MKPVQKFALKSGSKSLMLDLNQGLKACGVVAMLGLLAACGTNKTVAVSAKADTTPPVFASFVATPPVVTAVGQQVVIAADVADAQGPIAKVDFYRVLATGSTPILSFVVSDRSSPYGNSFAFNSSAQNGTYSYVAKAYDLEGNVAISAQASYTVDIPCTSACVLPTVDFVVNTTASPVAAANLLTAAGLVKLTAATANAKKVEFYRVVGTTETLITTDSSPPFALSFAFNATHNGTYTYKAKAISSSGSSAVSSASFTVRIKDNNLAAGFQNSSVIKANSTVLIWGENNYGQLGIGVNMTPSNVPVAVVGAAGATSIALGSAHALALKSDGTLLSWGSNEYGQLGNGSPDTSSNVPVQPLFNSTNMVAVAAGHQYSLALKSDGTVWSWGYNGSGQLGHGDTHDYGGPVRINNLTNVVAVAAGANHSLALKADGTVMAWGYNGAGQLGVSTISSVPAVVAGLSGVVAVAAGSNHSLALKSDGTVLAWGANDIGQLGANTGASAMSTSAVVVSGLSNIVAIASHQDHSLALKSDGTVWAWGGNTYGQLGNGAVFSGNSGAPAVVKGLSGVVAIAADYHSMALKADGSVYSWGRNTYGQLGNGTVINSTLAAPIELP